MKDNQVRIVELRPQKVAFTHGQGKEIGEPENEAWDKIMDWIEKNDVLEEAELHHFFGKNNPPPSEEEEEYGYDQMVTLYDDYEPDEDVEIRDLEGGLFAVTRIHTLEDIGDRWRDLYNWVQDSDEYDIAGHGLEELLSSPEDMIFDLWLPVKKK